MVALEGKVRGSGDHECLCKMSSQSAQRCFSQDKSVGLTHLRRFSGAGLSHHQHHLVFSDELDDLLLALMHVQGTPKTVQF